MRADQVQANLERAVSDRKSDADKLESRLMKEICDLKDDVRRLDEKVDDRFTRFEAKLDSFFDVADKKYAPAWVAWFVKIFIVAIITAVIGILSYLIQGHLI